MKIAYSLPEKILTNAELSTLYPGWSEEKILSKTGIASRHVSAEDETATDLAECAAKKLLEEGGVDPKAIDFVLLCTQSPDYKLPSSACVLQHKLGIPTSAGALDYDLGCSGYVYGLSLAKGLVSGGMARNVLLLTAETYTKYIHPMDKSVRTIFGDGASATLVDEDAVKAIGQFVFGTDGSGAKKLIVRTGGAREAVDFAAPEEDDASGNRRTKNNVFMSGPDIFNFTLDIVPKTMDEVCSKNGIDRNDVDLLVFHQANKFMLDTIRKVNGIPRDKFYIDLEDVGNTVSSTIPIALVRAQKKGVLKPGMKVMLMGFGVGLSWGATVITF
ncbi:MAG: ketoacyl-ACP synthase III [Kiritimatiellae bacterium]|nr:ketoacyl-ACP synthase III [Kiritimatiellia bacterium]